MDEISPTWTKAEGGRPASASEAGQSLPGTETRRFTKVASIARTLFCLGEDHVTLCFPNRGIGNTDIEMYIVDEDCEDFSTQSREGYEIPVPASWPASVWSMEGF